jgi:hypothetical protein
LLERAYLEASDPRGESGFLGDAAHWERARRLIVSAIDRDGTFLDAGEAEGVDTNGAVFTHIAWADLPDT